MVFKNLEEILLLEEKLMNFLPLAICSPGNFQQKYATIMQLYSVLFIQKMFYVVFLQEYYVI